MKNYLEQPYFKLSLKKTMIILGILGLTPFIFGLLDILFNKQNLFFLINIPKNYGVIILTFLGSYYWGIILSDKNNANLSNNVKILTVIWSIFPSIIGIIVLCIESYFSLIILSMGYLICHIVDEIYNTLSLFPKWYINLRRSLSSIVIGILSITYLIVSK